MFTSFRLTLIALVTASASIPVLVISWHGTPRGTLIAFILVGLFTGLGSLVAWLMSRPFQILSKHVVAYSIGDYDHPVPQFRFHEFRRFVVTLSMMKDQIVAQLDLFKRAAEQEKIKGEAEKAKAEAELLNLHRQMQPHFLFNTLNSIAVMIQTTPNNAVIMLEKLSALYRLILELSGSMTIPLEKEIQIASLYLDLQQMRFEERLRYRINISADILNIHIPFLLLQTLVENAIKHGISKSIEGGEIVIDIVKTGPSLFSCRVINGGALLEKNFNFGVGLRNTLKRLDLLYGPMHGFALTSTDREHPGRTLAEFFFTGEKR